MCDSKYRQGSRLDAVEALWTTKYSGGLPLLPHRCATLDSQPKVGEEYIAANRVFGDPYRFN